MTLRRRQVHGAVEPTVLSCSAGTAEAVRWLAVSVGQRGVEGGMCVCGLLPGGSRAGEDGGRTSKKELRRREEIRGSTCFPLWQDRILEGRWSMPQKISTSATMPTWNRRLFVSYGRCFSAAPL